MSTERPRSWMDEVGQTTPRRPSIPGPLIPFDIDTTPKTSRSQSYTVGQRAEMFGGWQRDMGEGEPLSRASTYHDQGVPEMMPTISSPSHYRPTFVPDLPDIPASTNLPAETMSCYYVVEFKLFRAEVYQYPLANLEIDVGELVIVDADRGTDLGNVVHKTSSLVQAQEFQKNMMIKHTQALLMYSEKAKHLIGTSALERPVIPPPPSRSNRSPFFEATGFENPWNPPTNPAEQDKIPKNIKRKAFKHEIMQLRDKEGLEAKAKRLCQSKAKDHGFGMEIVEAEFQIDYNKLTFYFVADGYVTFNQLVQDLFRQFKTRIWMSQVHLPTTPQTPQTPFMGDPTSPAGRPFINAPHAPPAAPPPQARLTPNLGSPVAQQHPNAWNPTPGAQRQQNPGPIARPRGTPGGWGSPSAERKNLWEQH